MNPKAIAKARRGSRMPGAWANVERKMKMPLDIGYRVYKWKLLENRPSDWRRNALTGAYEILADNRRMTDDALLRQQEDAVTLSADTRGLEYTTAMLIDGKKRGAGRWTYHRGDFTWTHVKSGKMRTYPRSSLAYDAEKSVVHVINTEENDARNA